MKQARHIKTEVMCSHLYRELQKVKLLEAENGTGYEDKVVDEMEMLGHKYVFSITQARGIMYNIVIIINTIHLKFAKGKSCIFSILHIHVNLTGIIISKCVHMSNPHIV